MDINQLAVHEAMRLYGVPRRERQECFEKVLFLVRELLLTRDEDV